MKKICFTEDKGLQCISFPFYFHPTLCFIRVIYINKYKYKNYKNVIGLDQLPSTSSFYSETNKQ